MSEVKVKAGESLDRAMKRLSKAIDREGTLNELRKRKYYEKPSVQNKLKRQRHKFENKLASKRNRLERKRV